MLHNSLWTRPTLNRLQSQNLRTLLIITTATSTTTTISIILTITTRALREFIIPLKKVKHLLSPYFRSLSPLPLFLHNFLSSSFGKKERILPCLIASCSELESTASHFATNVMIDTQTDKPSDQVKRIIPFLMYNYNFYLLQFQHYY